ncbi:HIT family protein [Paenibacillus aurantius]|uniref:HIT family protein n=1 Tax=Paenibacillus aurantius TaxID=2918900 RepID=A0AA96LDK3_9BACL|nr:HIT family protein [Paenibacillus aurantius]WJH36691.1 HIT family protein [Paenibacillus sp. CC-CFT747]WNQ12039.1 HIT family protein [Paenibacillus aurantius]
MHQECIYCSRDERLEKLMIEIMELSVSTLYLFKEQTYFGRCLIALNEHQREIFHLSEATRSLLMADMAKVAGAIEKAFLPDKINYGSYGDTMPHVHFHIVPKYKDMEMWGQPFEINPNRVYFTDEQYQGMIEKLIKYLA